MSRPRREHTSAAPGPQAIQPVCRGTALRSGGRAMNSMIDLWATAEIGIVVLAALAWVIGKIQSGAQDDAWRRIASARRQLAERKRMLDHCLSQPQCSDCPLRRFR